MNIVVIGGGAAGYFSAIHAAEKHPQAKVIILEKGKQVLTKVKISGGGRCNVTHDCYDPKELVQNYPRGTKELLGAFHRWQPADMLTWLEARGVPTKVEEDGRIFPQSNSSQTIIDCFTQRADELGVELQIRQEVTNLSFDGSWQVQTKQGQTLHAASVILCTGSMQNARIQDSLEKLGHTIVPPLPSLFTFHIEDARLKDLAGTAWEKVTARIVEEDFSQTGPLLVTHWGVSGPAILKLSAWAARELAKKDYRFSLAIDFVPQLSIEEVKHAFAEARKTHAKKFVRNACPISFRQKVWQQWCDLALSHSELPWNQLGKSAEETLIGWLKGSQLIVSGKSTNKEEFVTCGGVDLAEINFKTMESKKAPRLFFAGEVLNIDGVTGGFNFQSAWTTGRLAGLATYS